MFTVTAVIDSLAAFQQSSAFTKCFADIAPERLRWLWPGRIPLGKVTIIAGDPGLGKSLVTLDLAARVSRGGMWPDGSENLIGGVLLLSAEDDAADTIRPRLDACDANVENIHILESITVVDGDGRPDSKLVTLLDVEPVELWLHRHPDCRLIIIDPITAYLGDADSHKNAELRALLTPWAKLAADCGVAVVAVSHLTKNSSTSAMYRITGSLAFVAASRAVWVVCKDKQDPDRRLFLPVKCNLGPDQQGLAYRVFADGDAVMIEWEPDPVQIDAQDALAPDVPDRERPERDEAVEWLRDQLGNGPVTVKDLKKEAIAAGVAWRTLERAKVSAGVRARKRGMGGWIWEVNS